MIKGISFLRRAGDSAAYERLTSFFAALGFAHGAGWREESRHPNDEDLSSVTPSRHPNDEDLSSGTPSSRGAAFLAPLGNLEIVDGDLPSTAEVLVEVTALDAVHQAAGSWLRSQGGEEAAARLSPVTETHWKSRIFTVEPEVGFKISFWAWTDPAKGWPVAVEGDLSAEGMKFGLVVARWNAVITDRLLEGALDALLRSGAKRAEIDVIRVPGAWEIPAAARTVANLGHLDAIVALGCLLRGETAHYEAIYNEVARGIGQSQQETGIPHSFGVLTCETLEQALNRAGIKAGNKGFEAAVAAIEMVSLTRKLRQSSSAEGGQS
jgi:6,7-dimethyl-8-ribityllumazine synthase